MDSANVRKYDSSSGLTRDLFFFAVSLTFLSIVRDFAALFVHRIVIFQISLTILDTIAAFWFTRSPRSPFAVVAIDSSGCAICNRKWKKKKTTIKSRCGFYGTKWNYFVVYSNHHHCWEYCCHRPRTMLCLRNSLWRRVVDAAASIWPMASFVVHLDRKMATDYYLATEMRCGVCNRRVLFLDPATAKEASATLRNELVFDSRDASHTIYEVPLSVPASHGYNSTSLRSIHLQSVWQSSKPETPTNQSGDGNNIDTNDNKWWSESTRNTANVLPVIFG